MEATIVKIGNSQGLIIPKRILTTLGESKLVNVQIKDGGILITPLKDTSIRCDWEKQFADAISKGFKPDFSDDTENEFDKKEWTC
jgi:antitoxin MazE